MREITARGWPDWRCSSVIAASIFFSAVLLVAAGLSSTCSRTRAAQTSREAIQVALQWEGFYTQAIDGAFGPGTRRAMAAYQRARGFPETGVLTTRQRTQLVDEYKAAGIPASDA